MDENDIPAGIIMQAGIFPRELAMAPGLDYASRMTLPIIARNVVALRAFTNKKQEDFAALIGTQQANISKWENGTRVPESDNLSALAELAGVSERQFREALWEPGKSPKALPPKLSIEDFAADHDLALVDEIDLALGMGATFMDGAVDVKGFVPFRREWIRGMFEGPIDMLKVVRGRGDSMEPTIRDGDFVLIDTSQKRLDDQDIIWAISYGDLGMIRRLRQLPNGAVLMMPDNPVVRPDEAHDDEMFIMGKVIWIGRRMVSR